MPLSNDTRYNKHQLKIEAAFITLLTTYPYNQINVSQITQYAQINRSTFYSHFDSKDDLLDWIMVKVLDSFTNNITNFFKADNIQKKRIIINTYQIMDHEKNTINALWNIDCYQKNTYQLMNDIIYHSCLNHLKKNHLKIKNIKQEYIARQFSASALATLKWWYEEGSRHYAYDDLADIIIQSINSGIFQSLS